VSPSLTLFGPNNEAFALLQEESWYSQFTTVPYSLHLFSLLATHITSPAFTSSAFPILNIPNIAQGTIDVSVSTSTNATFVNSSNPDSAVLIETDVLASNGVAHVLDAVVWPDFVLLNLYEALQQLGPDYSSFLNLIEASGLKGTIENLTGATMLIPPNSGFAVETEQFLLEAENESVLTAVVEYHILPDIFNYASAPIPTITLRRSLQGENIIIGVVRRSNSETLETNFNDALFASTFLSRDNLGYTIEKILVPPSLSTIVPR
jgi:transforming growth factor-beta-induced protein